MVLFSATTERKNIKLNHIKEAHIIQAWCFFDATAARKVIYFNQINEADDIEAHDWQEGILFFSATTAKKKL